MKTRVRAIIIRNGNIILIKRTKKDEVYFVFPGGGVEEGETEKEALIREIKEELGVDAEVKESIVSQSFNKRGSDDIEHFYSCNILGGVIGTGDGPEFQKYSGYEGLHEIVEIPLLDISNINLLPTEVRDLVIKWFIVKKQL
ncbi:MAG: NUDIX domain-containing protein [bacterium]|nr:NUDIX domain-containing protein [bacterium]